MAGQADFDLVAAHKYFSAWCFNRAWDLIEKPDRTEAEIRLMATLSHASIFHWIAGRTARTKICLSNTGRPLEFKR
jgi:hypothetical protein